MEQTAEYLQQLESIKNSMECARNYDCLEQDDENLCSVRRVGELLECHKEDARICRYALPFGHSYFCKCSLNNHIHRVSGGHFDNKY